MFLRRQILGKQSVARLRNSRGMSVNILTAMNTGNNRRTAVSMRRPVNTPPTPERDNIGKLCFCALSVPRGYEKIQEWELTSPVWRRSRIPPPRVIGGDEKGSLRCEDSKIWSQVPRDSDPRKTAPARASSIYKRQTRPLAREDAPQKQDRNCQTVINIWSTRSEFWCTCTQESLVLIQFL
jgi:hypothetical protein